MLILTVHKSTDLIPFAIFWCEEYNIDYKDQILTIDSSIEITDWDYVTEFSGTDEECVDFMGKINLFLLRTTGRNKNIGSSFDDFLKEEGILEECTETAQQRINAPVDVSG